MIQDENSSPIVINDPTMLNVKEWKYRGEGSCNVVLGYVGSNPTFVKISPKLLELLEPLTEDANPLDRLTMCCVW